ncbi:MAG: endonuclease/exonuclease/phosphatase family protein, partial [Pseudomonadota bacterium]
RAVITPDLLDVGPGDYRHVRFDMRPLSLGWHGNAILVRNGVDVKRAEPLYLPSFEPRGAVLAELETAHGAVRVIGMHLDLSGLFRIRQLGWLMEMLSVRSPMPTIFMGDTNDWNRGRRAAMPTLPSRFTTAVCGPSFHTRRPTLHLDRIIHDEALHCRASGVHDSDLAKRASDHLPIWADLELRA